MDACADGKDLGHVPIATREAWRRHGTLSCGRRLIEDTTCLAFLSLSGPDAPEDDEGK